MSSSRPSSALPFERVLRLAGHGLRAPLALLRLLMGLWFYAMLLGLGLTSIAWNLCAFLLLPVVPRVRAQAIGRQAIARAYGGFWWCVGASGLMRVDSSELDRLNDEPSGVVIAANHPTMLDALLIVARLRRGVCIMKASLLHNPFLSAGARLARYIPNDSPRAMIRRSVASLQEGGQLVVFPEGTRTEQGVSLNSFRPGFTLIAHKAGVPIQTVLIETSTPYLRKGWPIWRMPPFPVAVRLRLGQRFEAEADHEATLKRIEDYFQKEVRS
jgi:1-acyl-sn-glycerol-3-phosphate acyltransferase